LPLWQWRVSLFEILDNLTALSDKTAGLPMSKKSKPPTNSGRRNPVAHFAPKVNRCAVFQDRTRYRRAAKHKGSEPFAMMLAVV
jgi:hypothetical protein